jgi:hypothetical protein
MFCPFVRNPAAVAFSCDIPDGLRRAAALSGGTEALGTGRKQRGIQSCGRCN